MKIGHIEVNNPLVLGPMAGVTDWAFRNICAGYISRVVSRKKQLIPQISAIISAIAGE